MKLTGDWLEAAGTQQVLGLLNGSGYQAYAVGGAPRNAVLGLPVADVDMCSDARPEEVIALAKAAGLKVIPTGIDHGTVTILAHGTPYEVTTFRHDVKTDGRHAEVSFSKDIQQDARRRDFTMNALYVQADGTLVDPLGGLPDALARHLRFVGDARTRIREDYLRILRFFRFLAHYGDPAQGPDPEGLAACAELGEGVAQLSKERIGAEVRKLLLASDPAPALASMAAAGVLAHLIEGADVKSMPVLIHLEEGRAPRWQRRLAVLGGVDPAPLLRLSRAEGVEINAIRRAALEGGSPAVLGYDLGIEAACDAILARAALIAMPAPLGWQEEVTRGAKARFPVVAADLMPEFSGPALGAKMRALQKYWKDSNLYPSKEELLAL